MAGLTIHKYNEDYFAGLLENSYRSLIKNLFPGIKNLVVSASNKEVSIEFDEGMYSKEEVLAKIEQAKKDFEFIKTFDPRGK
jgi:allophanate hydrolase subunit 1